uniref:Pyroglutamyl-peptidase I n=2 Tax=Panagrolaimus sp. JU765 TaxID=591449 RepID=A0AC34RAG5_9BILA
MPDTTRKKLVLTGFGPFGPYKENPSSVVVSKIGETGLPKDLSGNYELKTRLLDVVYDLVDCYVKDNVQQDDVHFYIHVGVHPFSKTIRLECQSQSEGYCREDINGSCPATMRPCCAPNNTCEVVQTKFDCRKAAEAIRSAIKPANIFVGTSEDPGKYLCGYVYYCTLKSTDGRSIFVHIPEFDEDATPELIQKIIVEIIREVVKQFPKLDFYFFQFVIFFIYQINNCGLYKQNLKRVSKMGKRRFEEVVDEEIPEIVEDTDDSISRIKKKKKKSKLSDGENGEKPVMEEIASPPIKKRRLVEEEEQVVQSAKKKKKNRELVNDVNGEGDDIQEIEVSSPVKKKNKHVEDEEVVLSAKKKKKNRELVNDVNGEDDDIQEIDVSSPARKKKKKNRDYVNGVRGDDADIQEIEVLNLTTEPVEEEEINDDEGVEYWILRKPKKMAIDDIPLKMKFPEKSVIKEAMYKSRSGKNIICANFHPTKKQTYLINRKDITESSNGKKKVEPYERPKGMVTLAYEDDDTLIAPIPPDEDFLRSHIEENIETDELKIPVIRKAPQILDDITERNKAFGVIKKKKHKK